MISDMKLIIKTLILTVFSFFWLVQASGDALAAAGFSLSPGSGTYGVGSTFAVTINVNTGGEAVNAVEAVLTFPSDKLKATGIGHGGSGFDINAESTIGAGVVKIAKGKLPPAVTGSRKVASVNFTALAQGEAAIAVSGQVLRESDSANIGGGGGGATFNIGAGAPVKEGQPQQSAKQPSGEPQKDSQAPNISEIDVLDLGAQTAVITWKTDEKADSQVEYGFVENRKSSEFKYFFNVSLEDRVTEHSVTLAPDTLTPGYLYHFRVKSTDAAANLSQSEDNTLLVPGYNLAVTVVDSQSAGVVGARVKVPAIGLEADSDAGGRVTFGDLPVGSFTVLVDYRGALTEKSVDLRASDNQVTIVLAQRVVKASPIWLSAGILILVIAIAGAIWFIRKRGQKQSKATPPL